MLLPTRVHIDPNIYGVALVSRIDKIIGLFCKRALWKSWYSTKETYNFINPTDRSHPIPHSPSHTLPPSPFLNLSLPHTCISVPCLSLSRVSLSHECVYYTQYTTPHTHSLSPSFAQMCHSHTCKCRPPYGNQPNWIAALRTLQHTATHRNTTQHTATHRNTPQHTATHCNTRSSKRTTTHRNAPQHTATHHNTPQRTAKHCNTPQHTAALDQAHALNCHAAHTATHYSTLQHTATLYPPKLHSTAVQRDSNFRRPISGDKVEEMCANLMRHLNTHVSSSYIHVQYEYDILIP